MEACYMANWLTELFSCEKPIIAMAHIPALPGTPRYDATAGIDGLIDKVRVDLEHLIQGGVDGVLFCNEDDRPYSFKAQPEQIAAMTRVVTELRPSEALFGVDFLWDPIAALSIAAASGAMFIREVVTGTYESDMGLWSPDSSALLRLRHQLGADNIRVLFNVAPEFCSPLGSRTVAERAKSAVVSSLADGILVSGPMAGAEPDYSTILEAKEAVGDDVPVLLNTGAKTSNIVEYLEVADGVIVGSSLKVDGHTWNPVDPARVREFVVRANTARQMTSA
jgi:membrane complex biogenesis BtpA family protein